jgi:hypothetical protein
MSPQCNLTAAWLAGTDHYPVSVGSWLQHVFELGVQLESACILSVDRAHMQGPLLAGRDLGFSSSFKYGLTVHKPPKMGKMT